ncbi:hypothetical protein H1230_09235 [Paenibacillus sp. 19GGS1-52]|uniref:hypothetical protein n=1 Tax=Paenibacillus sp. 19GGS1-52 TaxID=2758563 RepID=UPI001EFA3423|nr:hypothetical protein [Paenibacillus sp. 19GGS1-52]ULO08931.1 hypothetical protein H1230_09235 [Paenibacillus sp. 19GGS1-52]
MASSRARARRAGVQVTGEDNLQQLAARLRPLTEKKIRIGMQGDAELAMIASVHEYGSMKMNIPARSFIGTGKKKGQAPIGKLVRVGVTEIAHGRKSIDALFAEIGAVGLDRMVKNFNRIKQPALSARYAAHKTGPRKLLQRDEDLRDSLTFDVVPKGE